MYRLSTIISGQQRAASSVLRKSEAKTIFQDVLKLKKIDLETKIRGSTSQCMLHSGSRFSQSGKSTHITHEVWSDDVASFLQGTCLPGSTKYCRTNSMFGTLTLQDVMQGANQPLNNTSTAPKSRSFHTSASTERHFLSSKEIIKSCTSPVNCHTAPYFQNSGLTYTLQGSCLYVNPGPLSTESQGALLVYRNPAPSRSYSTDPAATPKGQLTQRQRLKLAVRDYGSTVIVFHIAISLMSLGACYLAVSSGLDVVSILSSLGVSDDIIQSRIATGTSTFLVSYAVHKVFAPVRIAITLTSTPFIVRYLRGIGVLKMKTAVGTK